MDDPVFAAASRSVKIGKNRIAFDDTGGDGSLILAIPGMGDLRSQYRHLRPSLTAAGHRVVTMDVRGFGGSSAKWTNYSAHAVGRDALALMDHLGAAAAVILGSSFAAGSALWAAREAPERVRGAVLLGPIVRDQKVSPAVQLLLDIGLAGPWGRWFWSAYWTSLFPARKPADLAEVRAAIRQNLREPGRMHALRSMIALSKADTEAILPATHVRSLIVMGTRDPDFADAASEAAQLATLLDAEMLLIEGAGHYPHAELPLLVLPRLLAFIADLAP